ncbi:MAG: sulfite exporter TauE/SafE family protein [Chloroflexi bacterium]|nr:sulfite exporter TauE/SafE family protein [Chloroflexota bacterium]
MADPQQLTEVFAQYSLWAVALAFILGIVSTLTPTTFALTPVIVGYVGAGARSGAAARGRALAFLGGISLVNVAVGALFGAAGAVAQQLVGGNVALWNALAGLLTLLVALAALGVLPLSFPGLSGLFGLAAPAGANSSWLGAFALGLPYGLVTCPTCVPLMVPVAIGAALTGAAWYGGLLFLAFAAGRGLPLLAIGGATGAFKQLRAVSRHMPAVERASAVLLLLAALYFLAEAARWALWGMSM